MMPSRAPSESSAGSPRSNRSRRLSPSCPTPVAARRSRPKPLRWLGRPDRCARARWQAGDARGRRDAGDRRRRGPRPAFDGTGAPGRRGGPGRAAGTRPLGDSNASVASASSVLVRSRRRSTFGAHVWTRRSTRWLATWTTRRWRASTRWSSSTVSAPAPSAMPSGPPQPATRSCVRCVPGQRGEGGDGATIIEL